MDSMAFEVTGWLSSVSETVGRNVDPFERIGGSVSTEEALRLVVRRERADMANEYSVQGQNRLF